MIEIIYTVGLGASAMLAYAHNTDKHWLERVGTVVMCFFWPIIAGACAIVILANAWDAYAYRKRGLATGDWRP